MIKPLPLLALALVASADAPEPSPRYVPATGWRDDARAVPFHEQWVGGQLRAMNEPPLATAADLGSWRRRFRLLVLPSFQPGYAFRIDEDAKGEGRLRQVTLDGRGGYAPGHIAKERERLLTRGEVSRIDRAIEAAGLKHLPMEPTPPRVKNGIIVVCADGTMYVFELLDGASRSFLERGCIAPKRPLRALIRAVAGLDLRPAAERAKTVGPKRN